MANLKISQLANGAPALGTDVFIIERGATPPNFSLKLSDVWNSFASVPNLNLGDSFGANIKFDTISNGSITFTDSVGSNITFDNASNIVVQCSGGVDLLSGSCEIDLAATIRFTDPLGSVWNLATGGNKGAGTINALGLFVNGVSVLALTNQNANTVLAGPTSGGAAAPTFRALVAGDIPNSTITPIWNNLQNATGNLTLANAGFTTTFNQTSAVNWTWANTTSATSGGVTVTYGSNSSATTSTTISLTIAVGDAVFVVANGNGAAAPTISDNGTAGGNTYTNLSTNAPFRLFSLVTATKTATVITVSVTSGTISATAVVFHGGSFSLGHVGVAGANAAATAASALAPSSATSQVLLFGVGTSATSAESVTAGYTIQASAGPNSGSSIAYTGIAAWNTSVAPYQLISGTFTCSSSTLTQAIAVEVVGGLGANAQQSPIQILSGTYWTGAASASDSWTLQNTISNASNGEPILKIVHSGSSGPATIEIDNAAILAYNTTVATVSTINTSPSLVLGANYWDGTISGMDSWLLTTSLAAGANAASILNITHAGTTGAAKVVMPALSFSSVVSNSGVLFGLGSSGTNNGAISLNVTGGSQACMSWGINGTTGLNTLTGFTGAADPGIYFSIYLGNSTAGAGVSGIFAKSNLVTQAAAITATTIYAVPNTANRTRSGLYRVNYSATITQAATASSSLGGSNGFQVSYTNVNDSVVKTSPVGTTSAANTTGTMISGSVMVYAKAGTNIQYTFDYTSSGATVMQYDLNIYVEFLG